MPKHCLQFQLLGSSYTESGNLVFRRAIFESEVSFHDIAEGMHLVTQLSICTPCALPILVDSVTTELENWKPNQVIAEALQSATGERLVSVQVQSGRLL